MPTTAATLHSRLPDSPVGGVAALVKALLVDRRYYWSNVVLLVLGETVLGLLIIWRIPCEPILEAVLIHSASQCLIRKSRAYEPDTKIDWDAYMQQVEGFLGGERDYSKLHGETGPLVYPALHLYIYTTLHLLVPASNRERPAQLLFLLLYLFNLLSISVIYYLAGRTPAKPNPAAATSAPTSSTPHGRLIPASQAFAAQQSNGNSDNHNDEPKESVSSPSPSRASLRHHLPQALLIPLALSKREHSIYMLRLFNDPIGMTFLYLAVVAFMLGSRRAWRIGSVFFSLALGVKMNTLLFVPGLLVVLVQYRGVVGTLESLAIIVAIQALLPAPFFLSLSDPSLNRAYFTSAFDLSRAFLYEWTVNWRFLSPKRFLSAEWATSLVLVHISLLLAFGWARWSPLPGGTRSVLRRALAYKAWSRPTVSAQHLPASHIPLVLFTSNFIGMTCARSLHYQFHSWYFLHLPLLLWYGGAWGSLAAGVTLWAMIEYAWSTAPATPLSSAVLLAGHVGILLGLWMTGPRPPWSRGRR